MSEIWQAPRPQAAIVCITQQTQYGVLLEIYASCDEARAFVIENAGQFGFVQHAIPGVAWTVRLALNLVFCPHCVEQYFAEFVSAESLLSFAEILPDEVVNQAGDWKGYRTTTPYSRWRYSGEDAWRSGGFSDTNRPT